MTHTQTAFCSNASLLQQDRNRSLAGRKASRPQIRKKTSPCKSMTPFHICSTITLNSECPRLSVTLRLHRGASTLLNRFTFKCLRDINKFSEVKARIRFCRLRLLGLQHLHVCLHLSTLGSSQFIQRNSSKFVNILYSILDATAYQNTFVALSQLISTWLAQACAPMNCASCIWEEAATDLEKIAIQQGFLSQN